MKKMGQERTLLMAEGNMKYFLKKHLTYYRDITII